MKRHINFLIAISFTCQAAANTLSGIVKQPTEPYAPAQDSVVKAYAKDGIRVIAGPDTTDSTGRYKLSVGRGQSVIVRATWKSTLSMPGQTETTVTKNPTEANVQLLPPKTAPEDEWFQIGRRQAILANNDAAAIARFLKNEDVPSAAIFSYLSGVVKTSPDKLPAAKEMNLFANTSTVSIVNAIKAADAKLDRKGTVPNFTELNTQSGGNLTPQQHIEVLSFIAPSGGKDRQKWESALGRSLDFKQRAQVLKKEKDFEKGLFKES